MEGLGGDRDSETWKEASSEGGSASTPAMCCRSKALLCLGEKNATRKRCAWKESVKGNNVKFTLQFA